MDVVRPGERVAIAAAFAGLLGLAAAQALLETARDTLLLQQVPIARLPWLTLGSALLGLVVVRLPRLFGAGRWKLVWSLIGGALVTATLAFVPARPWFPYVLYLWTGAFAAGAGLELWSSLGRLFHLGQAKRLFGLIAAGGGIGAVLGAALARGLLMATGPWALMAGAAILLALTVIPAFSLVRVLEQAPPATPELEGGTGPAARTTPYARRVLGFVFLAWVAFSLIDLQFKAGVAASIAPQAIGPFLATFQLLTGCVAIVVQLAVLGPLLRLVRLHRTLALLPAALALGAAAVLGGAGFPGMAAVKALDASFRQPLFRTAAELLYVPLGQRARKRLKALAELVGARAGQAVAAVAALIVFRLDPTLIGLVLALVLVLWTIAAARVGAEYLRLLRAQLHVAPAAPDDEPTAALAHVSDAGASMVPVLEERLLVEPEGRVRLRVLRTLVGLRERQPALRFDEDVLRRVAWRSIEIALLCLDWQRQLERGAVRRPERATPLHQRLAELLEDKRGRAQEQLFLVLALRYPGEDFAQIQAGLGAADPRLRAASRELLGSTLEGPARRLTLLLSADVPDDRRIALAAPYYQPHAAGSYDQLLEVIAREGGGKLSQLALLHLAELRPRSRREIEPEPLHSPPDHSSRVTMH